MEVLGGLDVGGDVPHPEQFGDVAELGEAGLHSEAGSVGCQLEAGGHLAEGGCQGVEVSESSILE